MLGDDNYRVKVIEPYQVLGEIDDALREALGIDVVGIITRCSMFGTQQQGWKPFTLNDGTEVLVTEDFNYYTRRVRQYLRSPARRHVRSAKRTHA